MRHQELLLVAALGVAAAALPPSPAAADSFADAVTDFSPVIKSGEPTAPHLGADNAVGAPDYINVNVCADAASCTWVSLGDGGSITLRFVDNALTGSDNTDPDLWIYEIGPDVEDTYVEISSDGVLWNPVGKVFGSTSTVDVDAFGFGSGDSFSYVRLTDDPNEGGQSGATVGADIDAVEALTTVPVPAVPATWGLLKTRY